MKSIYSLIASIRDERNTDKRIRMLEELNNSLPAESRIEIPSLITNAYIRRALDMIEERIAVPVHADA
jgi:hypothetical protein